MSSPERIDDEDGSSLLITSFAVTMWEQVVYVWTLVAFWRTALVARYWFLVVVTYSAVFIDWSIYSAIPGISEIDPKRLAQLVMFAAAVLLCVVLAYMYRLERSERLAAQDLSVENLRLASEVG
jgi:hypothetical protein